VNIPPLGRGVGKQAAIPAKPIKQEVETSIEETSMSQIQSEHIMNNKASKTENSGPAKAQEQAVYRAKVRELNDQLRRFGRGGMIVMTDGIATSDRQTITSIFAAIAAFDAFTEDNDPWGEHDCAILNVAGLNVMYKIDYFDRSRTYHSPNPSDPTVTTRVMTIMQADEY
jgi:Protein of unknown function (DUF3768)